MNSTLHPCASQHTTLGRQKSMSTLSTHSKLEPSQFRDNTNSEFSLTLPPVPQNSPPPIPVTAPVMIQLPGGREVSYEEIKPFLLTKTFSTPLHIYRAPHYAKPMPIFTQGQNRFPSRERWWHSPSVENPHRYAIPPGPFTKPDFDFYWNQQARIVDDSAIYTIQHERMFTGIYYRIDIDPAVWGDVPICRGDIIIFRGFEEENVKYMVTWERCSLICEGTAYVQVNAMDKDRHTIEPSDRDWPTIGFYVPAHLCAATPSPHPNIPYDPLAKITFVNPFTEEPLPSTYDDLINLTRINRRNALVPEASSPPRRWLTRKLSGIVKCGN